MGRRRSRRGAGRGVVTLAAALWAAGLGGTGLARGQAPPAAPDKPDKPEYKPFAEVTKGFEPIDGFFPLYYNPKSDKLLAVIPKTMLDSNFLMAQSIAAGGSLTGSQVGHRVVQWREMDKKLVLIQPELRYLEGDKATVGDVIKRTYADSIVLATGIVTKRDADPVIDLDEVFKSDLLGLGRTSGGGVDASISKWAKKKGFKDNIELAVDLAVMRGPAGGTPVTVHYSISRLPQTDYKPREADERIGYFLTARKDWSAPHAERTIFKRFINRWQLRKSDPKEKVSDVHPDDQIVFYIEKTVPVQYRRYIREGILEWNKAFEKAGLRNAMQVRQQTATNEFANLDPEDVNYNFFRWIVSGRSFARGPSRANPLTGQILDADIIMDDSIVRVWSTTYDRMTAQGPSAGGDAQFDSFLGLHPEWRFEMFEDRMLPESSRLKHALTDWEGDPREMLAQLHPEDSCELAGFLAHEMAFADAFLNAAGCANQREDYVGQWVRLVATHEVGHTLGLRHNFKASSWKSLTDILNTQDPATPTSASVMDYLPAVYNLDRTNRPLFVTQAVGPYDELAIEYGYRVLMEGEEEKVVLGEVAKRMAEQGLPYATDEDSGGLAPDPLVNAYDNTSDPLEWARYRMDLVGSLQKDMLEWAVADGDSYHQLRQAFDMFLFEYSRAAQSAARMIGGEYLARDRKGDPQARPPSTVVPSAQQRAALALLADKVFSDQAFQFPAELLCRLAPGRWEHWDSDAFDSLQEYPLHDRIAAVQHWSLFYVTNAATLERVRDAELKVADGTASFTAAELLETVARTIWSEVQPGAAAASAAPAEGPRIPSLRRGLQHRHLQALTGIVVTDGRGAYPPDVVAVARMILTDLSGRMDEVLAAGGRWDDVSRAHLQGCRARIDKVLKAEYRLGMQLQRKDWNQDEAKSAIHVSGRAGRNGTRRGRGSAGPGGAWGSGSSSGGACGRGCGEGGGTRVPQVRRSYERYGGDQGLCNTLSG